MSWRSEAACDGANPDIFFLGYGSTEGRGHASLNKTAKARAMELCAGCPVTDECLTYALALPLSDDFGIWGGTTELQRVGLRRARKQHQPPRSRTKPLQTKSLQETARL